MILDFPLPPAEISGDGLKLFVMGMRLGTVKMSFRPCTNPNQYPNSASQRHAAMMGEIDRFERGFLSEIFQMARLSRGEFWDGLSRTYCSRLSAWSNAFRSYNATEQTPETPYQGILYSSEAKLNKVK